MSGFWDSGDGYLEFTPGAFSGSGAFTIAALANPAGSTHGIAAWTNGGAAKGGLLLSGWSVFGNDDFTPGFGPVDISGNSPGWQVWVITKAAGASHYRAHIWDYDPTGSGTMSHGEAAGAGNHPDYPVAEAIRVGGGVVPGNGGIAVVAMLDRALSDAECETLVSTSLADWAALSPDFAVELSDPTAPNVFAGTSTLVGGGSGATDVADPSGFDFSVTPPPGNVGPTVNAGADQNVTGGDVVTVTASAADSDGTIESYTWVRISGPAVTLAGTGASRTFTAPDVDGTTVLRVTVVDDDGASAQDTVSINISAQPVVVPPTPGTIKPFTSMERALMALIVRDGLVVDGVETPVDEDQVGGDFGYDPDAFPWYIRIDKVPGGQSDRHQGTFVLDLEVFGADYLLTENVAFALGALVLGYPHVVEVDDRKVVFDDVTENVGPADLPWEDDSTYRIGATYVITARRR
jgi:hypothetical protein